MTDFENYYCSTKDPNGKYHSLISFRKGQTKAGKDYTEAVINLSKLDQAKAAGCRVWQNKKGETLMSLYVNQSKRDGGEPSRPAPHPTGPDLGDEIPF